MKNFPGSGFIKGFLMASALDAGCQNVQGPDQGQPQEVAQPKQTIRTPDLIQSKDETSAESNFELQRASYGLRYCGVLLDRQDIKPTSGIRQSDSTVWSIEDGQEKTVVTCKFDTSKSINFLFDGILVKAECDYQRDISCKELHSRSKLAPSETKVRAIRIEENGPAGMKYEDTDDLKAGRVADGLVDTVNIQSPDGKTKLDFRKSDNSNDARMAHQKRFSQLCTAVFEALQGNTFIQEKKGKRR